MPDFKAGFDEVEKTYTFIYTGKGAWSFCLLEVISWLLRRLYVVKNFNSSVNIVVRL
jgi:hypothetical protein